MLYLHINFKQSSLEVKTKPSHLCCSDIAKATLYE
jgi:hypothetical protein